MFPKKFRPLYLLYWPKIKGSVEPGVSLTKINGFFMEVEPRMLVTGKPSDKRCLNPTNIMKFLRDEACGGPPTVHVNTLVNPPPPL